MFNEFFKLSYILYLQKKYWNKFTLAPEGIFVIPPIFKKQKIVYSLAFPVVKRDENNNISRPIGIILVSKQGKETIFDLNSYDYTNISQDFNKKYTYKMEKQEDVKTTLELLSNSLPSVFIKHNKSFNEYISRLKALFDKDFWKFYEDLEENEITQISNDILYERKQFNLPQEKEDIMEIIKTSKRRKDLISQINNFIKQDILQELKTKTYIKLLFLDELGKYLKTLDIKKQNNIEDIKFEITKIFAKNICKTINNNAQVSYISKIFIMMLNNLIIKQIKPEKQEEMNKEYDEYNDIFVNELDSLEDSQEKQTINIFYTQLKRNKNISNIYYAYNFIFCK